MISSLRSKNKEVLKNINSWNIYKAKWIWRFHKINERVFKPIKISMNPNYNLFWIYHQQIKRMNNLNFLIFKLSSIKKVKLAFSKENQI